jgi:hypothetical protein
LTQQLSHSGRPQHRTRFQRVLMAFVLLMLSVQLLGVAFHKHDYADTRSDCASCSFTHHLPSGLPDLQIDVPPSVARLSYAILVATAYRFVAPVSFLIPRSQAPPAA